MTLTKWQAAITMVMAAAYWAGGTVMSRELLATFTPLTLIGVQQLSGLLFITIIVLIKREKQKLDWQLMKAALFGLFFAITNILDIFGLDLTTAGKAGVIMASEPILIVLMAWLLLSQRPSRKLIFGIMIAGLGLFLISKDSLNRDTDSGLLGDLLIVIAAGFAATYVVCSAKIINQFSAIMIMLVQQFTILIAIFIALFIMRYFGYEQQDWQLINNYDLLYASVAGIVQYGLAGWFYLIALRYLSAGTASLWFSSMPIFSLIAAYFWLGEIASVAMLIGTLLILLAIFINRKDESAA